MKNTKLFALALSGIMAVAAIPVASASAEEYIKGDIDMDGIITEHDSSMLYRYLDEKAGIAPVIEEDDILLGSKAAVLTEEQLDLADINGDGIVDYSDADEILANIEYRLGDANMDGIVSVADASLTLSEYAHGAAGLPLTFTDVQNNLIDLNANQNGCFLSVGTASRILGLYVAQSINDYSILTGWVLSYEYYNVEHNYFVTSFTK